MLNVVAIQGRLGRDPELKQTQSGKNVCTFRIACDRGRKDANGNSVADWIDVTAWEKTAELVCKYFPKGSMIIVEGRLQTRQYQDKNGNSRTATEVLASSVNFCGGRNDSQSNQSAARPQTSEPDYEPISDDGDLPF